MVSTRLPPPHSPHPSHPAGAVERSNLVDPHSSSLSRPGPTHTARPNAGALVPVDGLDDVQTGSLAPVRLPLALVEDPTDAPARRTTRAGGAATPGGRTRPGQDDDDDVSLFTIHSRINEDGDEKEEIDFSIPDEEFSITKTIVRALLYALAQAARPFAWCGEEIVYNETCGLYAMYDRVYACVFPEIDYSTMNAVLAAKVRHSLTGRVFYSAHKALSLD